MSFARTRDLVGPTAPPARYRVALMLALVTIPVLLLDQLSKHLVSAQFQPYQSRPIVPGWLDLTYTLNPGAAFSLFATMPAAFRQVFFVGLSCGAIVVLTVLLARDTSARASAIAFALILGGTIGNLIDRLARGRVVDFIYFPHARFSYPVFNFADSAITIGVALILISSAFGPGAPQT
ncbi:MAG: signal peptidase II [Candidatus Binataceae bacterium]